MVVHSSHGFVGVTAVRQPHVHLDHVHAQLAHMIDVSCRHHCNSWGDGVVNHLLLLISLMLLLQVLDMLLMLLLVQELGAVDLSNLLGCSPS